MPSIITHQMFGTEVFAELKSVIGQSDAEREAFLLGNHGPDPLLFLRVSPVSPWCRKAGGLMHSQRPSELLFAFHDRFVASRENGDGDAATRGENASASAGGATTRGENARGENARGENARGASESAVLKAYALGFLCHYLLDSTVHPLVFAQQRAYCDSGVEGLTREHDWHAVHFLIEAELDEYVLASKLGVTVKEYVPHNEALQCANGDLAAISTAYSDVIWRMYGKKVPRILFKIGVHVYRTVQFALDSRRSAFGQRVDYAYAAGPFYLDVDALTHSGVLRMSTPFANDDHVAWPHCHNEGEVVSGSFDELYDAAFSRALELIPRYAQEGLSLDDCRLMTHGLNFSGKRVES